MKLLVEILAAALVMTLAVAAHAGTVGTGAITVFACDSAAGETSVNLACDNAPGGSCAAAVKTFTETHKFKLESLEGLRFFLLKGKDVLILQCRAE